MAKISCRTFLLWVAVLTCYNISRRLVKQCSTEECRTRAELKWFFGAVLVLFVVGMYYFIRDKINLSRKGTSCKDYTTAKGATPEKVYVQLRKKWLAHEFHLKTVLQENPLKVKRIENAQWKRMTELLNQIKDESDRCHEFFANKKYQALLFSSDSSDIPTLFADQVEVIESFAAQINELEEIVTPKRKKTCGPCYV